MEGPRPMPGHSTASPRISTPLTARTPRRMPTSTAPTRPRRPATANELIAPGIHPRDSKHGKVTTEHATIGADEPFIVFRAKDKLLPALLDAYAERCAAAGS